MIRSNYFEKSVSRETLVKISKYHSFLIENNRKMSLISKNSENIAIDRHYVDCAQLIKYLDKSDKTILDIGSGAGLPGIILDIIKKDYNLEFSTHLVEKSPKKVKFLNEANSFLDLDIKIHNCDVRMISKKNFTTLVSRAFKPMKEFLEIIIESNIDFKKIILMKGEKFLEEINEAKKYFEINCESYKSITNPSSKVFVIKGVSKI
ncbi:16S rRNA (guanine(527)-N(7))-methyltransferase RsmG [Pelagibacteraceae bacterium]|nr:16S rRNA (guanine(527)-N(7))-methyltransferase RsmG [Pelagibacteraceae bacterium]